MPGTIWSCPSCKALILEDTVQCPECNHILDSSRYQDLSGTASGAAAKPLAPKQIACPTCGEMVREGLVRCWNCGSFMREDVAELYRNMQAKPAPVIYSNRPDAEPIYTVEDPEELEIRSSSADDDFELSSDISALRHSQRQGDAAPNVAAPPAAGASPASDESDTYTLSASASGAETPPAPAASDSPSSTETRNEGTGGDTTTPTKADETGDQTDSQTSSASEEEEATDQPHSVATGGDALLEIALEEESEADKRREQAPKRPVRTRVIEGFLVFCPNGHRIEVQDKHRGKAGRCPKCKAVFIVPEIERQEQPKPAGAEGTDQTAGAEQPAEEEAAGAYTRWMTDVHLHAVNPEKLRLKPGSLEKDYREVDVAFSPDQLLIATLVASRGLFGLGGGEDKESARSTLRDRLREEVPIDDLPVADKLLLDNEAIKKLSIDQPVVYEHESMFVGVPVFGRGRIAVRIPKTKEGELPRFLSFSLSGFRTFSRNLAELYGIEEFGVLNEIPLADEFSEQTCHYSEETFRVLQHLEFYQADPTYELKLVGRKCAACGLIVSEDSRKREKIGGSSGRGIARAKCPKCGGKFGDISLYDLEQPTTAEQEPEATTDEPATTKE